MGACVARGRRSKVSTTPAFSRLKRHCLDVLHHPGQDERARLTPLVGALGDDCWRVRVRCPR
ncbi:MAG: hypothetical protein EPO01_14590 [Aquabacterium sp.]|nr:MAG: hypothetical protein EPO01_14590 [Aquabacterium sp.]